MMYAPRAASAGILANLIMAIFFLTLAALLFCVTEAGSLQSIFGCEEVPNTSYGSPGDHFCKDVPVYDPRYFNSDMSPKRAHAMPHSIK